MRYFIVPGYQADTMSAWYSWLDQYIEDNFSASASILTLPSEQALNADAWQDLLQYAIGDNEQEVCLIGHSLGCIHLLRYLETRSNLKANVLLVSGFYTPLKTLPELTPLMRKPFDFDAIRLSLKKRLVLSAQDDPVVPWQQSVALAHQLQADTYLKNSGGHFLGRRQPVVASVLKQMMEL